MKFRSLAAAAAALTLMATPVLAQSAAADLGRTVAPVSGESALEGDSSILAIIALLLLGLGVALGGGNNGDSPASP